MDYEGTSVDLAETYTCDRCGKKLKITAKCHFMVEEIKEEIFEEEYVSQIESSMLGD